MTARDDRAEAARRVADAERAMLSRRSMLKGATAVGLGAGGLSGLLASVGQAGAAGRGAGSPPSMRGTQDFATPADGARFPDGFVWGAATSAYQIEGAVAEGGRGPSIWDTFCREPGKVSGGDTGDVACDHYHRYAEDVGLMRELGLGAYRFSIAWPRVVPTGVRPSNQAGLDFYKRLVDELRAADIEPWATLYHWDLPQALQDNGGWANRDAAARFGEYAQAVVDALGDGIGRWMTLNEPWVAAVLGNLTGDHAPGLRDLPTTLKVAHHLLLAHVEATAALRAAARPGDQVGIVVNLSPVRPLTDDAAAAAAAARYDAFLNRWFLDPLFRAEYPPELRELYAAAVPGTVQAGDLERIAAPLDFLGINYYFPSVVRDDPTMPPSRASVDWTPRGPITGMGWPIDPAGLAEIVTRVNRDYAPAALYVTENGAAFGDVSAGGEINDPQREAYLRDHLLAAHRVIEAGVPLRGYFAWSLLDNFEWAFGYAERFGLIGVDYATQARTIKQSGRWYAGAIRDNVVRA